MALSIRHRDDRPPALEALAGLRVGREERPDVLAEVQGREADALARRLAEGHRAYVASFKGEPAAWGWVATRSATIGELGISFAVPEGERYLWNFVTHPAHRGKGIYPRLLDGIVRAESGEAARFWIIHAPENHASAAGIRKAGFTPVGDLSWDPGGRPGWRGSAGAATDPGELLGGPESPEPLAPCWKCARAGRAWIMFCRPGACRCDYQRPERTCHAG